HVWQSAVLALGPTILDAKIAVFDEANFIEPAPKLGDQRSLAVWRSAIKKPDHRHRALLRAHCSRPSRRRAAEKNHELASFDHGRCLIAYRYFSFLRYSGRDFLKLVLLEMTRTGHKHETIGPSRASKLLRRQPGPNRRPYCDHEGID